MTSRCISKNWKFFALVALVAMGMGVSGCGDKNDSTVTNPNPNNLSPTGTITGTITDKTYPYEPIEGAIIDLGVGSATTDKNGVYKIMNVPATSNANGNPQGEYVGTIDLRNVTSPVKMNDSTYTGFRYPSTVPISISVPFSSFQENQGGGAPGSGSGSNHDTPIIGLVADGSYSVGKLASSINVLVVKDNGPRTPVGAGYTVTVLRGQAAVFVGQTDANSQVLVPNLESRTSYLISAIAPDKSLFGDSTYTTPVDGKTLTLSAQYVSGSNLLVGPAILVGTTDQYSPKVLSTSPGNNADIQDNTALGFLINFTEPIANTTTYASAVTPGAASVSGLWNDVIVSFDGTKAGEIVHSISWVSNTQLAITFPTLAPSSKYSVTLKCNALKNLKDVNGNPIDGFAGTCPDVSVDKVFRFTTNTSGTAVAPTNVVVVNASTINYNTTAVNLDWPPATGAFAYNIYRSKVLKLGGYTGDEALGAYKRIGTNVSESQFSDTLVTNAYVDGQNQVLYRYKVVSLNSDYSESAESAPVDAVDVVEPWLSGPNNAFRADFADGNNTLNVLFNEPVDEVSAEVAANYTVVGFNGTTPVAVSSAFMNSDLTTVTLTLDQAMDNNVGSTFRPLVWPHVKAGADNTCNTTTIGVNDVAPAAMAAYAVTDPVYLRVCVTMDNAAVPQTAAGDDVLAADNTVIYAGPNGICQTTATGANHQTSAVNSVSPDYICANSGTDLKFNTLLNGCPSYVGETCTVLSASDTVVYPVVVTVTGVRDIAGRVINTTGDQIGTDGSAH